MSKNKQYKNVYTILEKVKKGEIEAHYKDKEGLFGKIDFYKRPDLIKPHMHYLDENKLSNIIEGYINQGGGNSQLIDFFNKFHKHSKVKAMDPTKTPNMADFMHKVQDTYRKFPKHISRDIYKMFYHKIDHLEFEERTDRTHTKFKFLEQANNPVAKIMTQTSNLKSAIFARNTMLYYMMQLTAMEYIDPEQHQKMMNSLQDGDSEFDSKDMDKAFNDMFGNKQAKEQLENAMQKAQDMCKQMDENIPEEVQQQMFENADRRDSEAGKLSENYLRQVAANLQSISMSMGSLKDRIKKLLDKTTSYFSSNEIVKYEDLFNSDNIAGLDDFLPLHPHMRKFMIEDVMIKDVKRVGKIDIYIDVSGSMHSDCGAVNSEGQRIAKIDFCKAFAAKLKEMNMLNDVYLFDTRVKKYRSDIISLSMIGCGGGTAISNAVYQIERIGNNAIVITDAEDSCDVFSEKAFFIGVKGSNFRHFADATIKQYSDRGQVVVFTGKSILKVNDKGSVIT